MLSWYTEYVSTFRGLVAGFQDNFPQHYWLRFILKMCCFASNVIHQRPGTHFCKTVEVNHAWNHQVTNENFWRKSLRKLCVICTQYKSLYPNNSRTVIFFSKVQIFSTNWQTTRITTNPKPHPGSTHLSTHIYKQSWFNKPTRPNGILWSLCQTNRIPFLNRHAITSTSLQSIIFIPMPSWTL